MSIVTNSKNWNGEENTSSISIAVKSRENWIDWSKTILIWLMVLGHAGLNGIPREFVYAFHMPAFFIISGYLYKPHSWLRTLKGFGLPIIFFSAINLCYVILRSELKGESILDGDLILRITPPYWRCNYGEYISLFRGVWFVVVLFWMRLLLGDIPVFSFVRKHVHWFILILVAYMSLEFLFDSHTKNLQNYYAYKVLGCLPFMMIGMILKEHRRHLLSVSKYVLAMLLVAFVLIVLFNGATEIWAYHFGKHYLLFFLAAIAASLVLFNLCKTWRPNRIVETFSRGTLLILGLHSPIIEISNKIFDVLHFPCPCLASSVIVMVVCYYPIRIALRYCPAVLGK